MKIEIPEHLVKTAQELAELFGVSVDEIFHEHSGRIIQQYINGIDDLGDLLSIWWWYPDEAESIARRIKEKYPQLTVRVEQYDKERDDLYQVYVA